MPAQVWSPALITNTAPTTQPQGKAIIQAGARAVIVANQTLSHRRTKNLSLFTEAERAEEVCLVEGERTPSVT